MGRFYGIRPCCGYQLFRNYGLQAVFCAVFTREYNTTMGLKQAMKNASTEVGALDLRVQIFLKISNVSEVPMAM